MFQASVKSSSVFDLLVLPSFGYEKMIFFLKTFNHSFNRRLLPQVVLEDHVDPAVSTLKRAGAIVAHEGDEASFLRNFVFEDQTAMLINDCFQFMRSSNYIMESNREKVLTYEDYGKLRRRAALLLCQFSQDWQRHVLASDDHVLASDDIKHFWFAEFFRVASFPVDYNAAVPRFSLSIDEVKHVQAVADCFSSVDLGRLTFLGMGTDDIAPDEHKVAILNERFAFFRKALETFSFSDDDKQLLSSGDLGKAICGEWANKAESLEKLNGIIRGNMLGQLSGEEACLANIQRYLAKKQSESVWFFQKDIRRQKLAVAEKFKDFLRPPSFQLDLDCMIDDLARGSQGASHAGGGGAAEALGGGGGAAAAVDTMENPWVEFKRVTAEAGASQEVKRYILDAYLERALAYVVFAEDEDVAAHSDNPEVVKAKDFVTRMMGYIKYKQPSLSIPDDLLSSPGLSRPVLPGAGGAAAAAPGGV